MVTWNTLKFYTKWHQNWIDLIASASACVWHKLTAVLEPENVMMKAY
jgi:hypothetical protein